MSNRVIWEQNRIVKLGSMYRYMDLESHLAALAERYEFIYCESIGYSVLSKPIWGIRIGNGVRKVHINASVHANEWITTPLLLRFVEDYAGIIAGQDSGLELPSRVNEWFEETTLWIVPMVNPDGVDLSQVGLDPACPWNEQLLKWNEGNPDFSRWKANLRGVDLNDQFPAHWEIEQSRRGITGPASQDYGGAAPLTEPEARALADLTIREQFDLVLSLHSQGKEIYWNYRGYEPIEAEELAERLANEGNYRAVKLTGSDAGYKDWFIQQFRKPGFTVEVGEGVNPLPVSQFEEIYIDLKKILIAAMDTRG